MWAARDVKVLATGKKEPDQNSVSGPKMTAKENGEGSSRRQLTGLDLRILSPWDIPVRWSTDNPLSEPHNLGGGWVGFDFGKAFGRPIKIVNDAAMQALGSLLRAEECSFSGWATGLGSAMIVDGILEPRKSPICRTKKGRTYEDYLGIRGLKRLGKK